VDVQWIILAKQYQTNEDGTQDIMGIFRDVPVPTLPYPVPMTIISKVLPEPTDVGEHKVLTLRIQHADGGDQANIGIEAPVFDMASWGKAIPFLIIRLEIPFQRVGLHSFRLSTEDGSAVEEFVMVTLNEQEA